MTPFDPRFEKVAYLRDDRKKEGDKRERLEVVQPGEGRQCDPGKHAADNATDRATLRLARRNGGREFWPSKRTPNEICRDVGCPNHSEKEENGVEARLIPVTQKGE